MAPNLASNGVVANGNGAHMNGKAAAHTDGNGTAARPAVAPKSSHEDRWAGVERPYSQVCSTSHDSIKPELPRTSKALRPATTEDLSSCAKA